MIKFSVIGFYGIYYKFDVKLARGFRVLNKIPKCWKEVTSCTTSHNTYESGTTTIYHSKTTKKYYMVRYFDGCFSKMYAEVNGIDWYRLKDEISSFYKSTDAMRHEMWYACENGEMTYKEKNIREKRIRDKAKDLLIKLVG